MRSPPHLADRADRARRARIRPLAVSLALAACAHATLGGAFTLALVGAPTAAYAQRSVSTQKLIDQARERFDEQQYDESIQKLSAALLRPDITPAQKTDVYRWLAYNYIVLRQDDSARTAIFALYGLDDSFTLPARESPKFREPFARYRQQWIDEGRPGRVESARSAGPISLRHNPPAEVPREQTIAVSGTVQDPERRVARVALFYRTGSTAKFVSTDAVFGQGAFRGNIPASAARPPIVEYYLQAYDKGGLPIANRGDAEAPLRVVVEAPKESVLTAWWFWTGAGAVVAGGVVAGLLLSKKSSTPGAPVAPGANVTITVSE